ncbi:MAG: hypothetical protein E6J90_04305 [Deltaproteobacteria bacterium]|nr:MAG: hypothetical protein E6J91_43785 [Deltaproteobacteria bacterium]TMQ26513.1 MAG: hypothetical protein E6J90_04305 [Deltaproteobacteria bacterium]
MSRSDPELLHQRPVSGRRDPIESLEALIDEELAKANQRILAGTPNGAYYRTWVLGKGLTKIERAAATTPPGS